MVIVHYLSRYPEVIKLRSTTISADFNFFKVVYSRHGILYMPGLYYSYQLRSRSLSDQGSLEVCEFCGICQNWPFDRY